MSRNNGTSSLFPPGFVWGGAASSYQIEGGSSPDLRGESVWDAFCRKPGAINEGHTGQVACDHYTRMREDVGLMAGMGLQAYRLSISWPRVLREGTGNVNQIGLDFYDRLVDALVERNIEPWITLFHWDFPLALYMKGGWLNRDSAEWFGEYTTRIVERLSDRVVHWMTINEPQVYVQLGHADGTHAPGVKLPLREQLTVVHNTLRAHGRGAQAIRAAARRVPSVGWAPVGSVSYPLDSDPANIEAARAATFSVTKNDLWNNTWFSDPVCFGCYPEDGLRLYGSNVPAHPIGDMDLIRQPLDFYGVNIYSGTPVKDVGGVPTPVTRAPGYARNTFNWAMAPESLRWGPRFIFERYRLPVVITENGMSNLDWPDANGQVLDPQRIDYTRRYLLALHQAIADGADVRGYFHWSVFDNFEWAEGYKERFGLVHVDFTTQKRTPKLSAGWYQNVIASNGRSLTHTPSAPMPADFAPIEDVRTTPKPLAARPERTT
ncbi:MAG TPA: GH1 family beta-glucosidase [Phycisphaerales bacterium]|nr:GH1 family beta-glucosidase [Phycisphaerales bacterium]